MQDAAITHCINVLLDDQRKRYSGGLERFLAKLAIEGGRKEFEEWADHPMTRLVLSALKSLAETVPLANPSDHGGCATALGCASGLGFAVRLIEDPTRIFPSIYDGPGVIAARKAESEIEETYEAPPDGETSEVPVAPIRRPLDRKLKPNREK